MRADGVFSRDTCRRLRPPSVPLDARDWQTVRRHGHRASVVVLIAELLAASINLARKPRVFLVTAPVAKHVARRSLATLGISRLPHRHGKYPRAAPGVRAPRQVRVGRRLRIRETAGQDRTAGTYETTMSADS